MILRSVAPLSIYLGTMLGLHAPSLSPAAHAQDVDPRIPRPWQAPKLPQRSAGDPVFVEDDVEILFSRSSEQAGDGFGWVAEDLGDLNQDGAPDLIVTAPFYTTNLPFPAGRIYILSGIDGSVLNRVTSPGVAVFGYSAKDAGDVDGDGVGDYIVGSFSSAMVFSGATHAILHIWHQAGEFFGSAVAGVGDLDGDGFDDVTVASRYYGQSKANRGRVVAYSGATGQALWTRHGRRTGDELGTALGRMGDVNGDGIPEVVAGARGAGAHEEGRCYLLSGRDGRFLRRMRPVGEPGLVTDAAGVTAGTFAQFHAFGIGDVDGDGIDDVYVGDYNARQAEVDGSGRGYIFSGRTGRRLHVFGPEAPGDGLGPGRSVADLDGDGVRELFIAAHTFTGGSQAGKGYLYSGASFQLLRSLTGAQPAQFLGVDALGLDDANGDGHGELLLTGNGIIHLVAGQSPG